MMAQFTGYTALPALVLSDDAQDRVVTVYLRTADRAVFLLDISGCPCCGDIWDEAKAENLEPVTGGVVALGAYLVGATNDMGTTSAEEYEDRLATMREIVAAVAAGPAPELPA